MVADESPGSAVGSPGHVYAHAFSQRGSPQAGAGWMMGLGGVGEEEGDSVVGGGGVMKASLNPAFELHGGGPQQASNSQVLEQVFAIQALVQVRGFRVKPWCR